MVGEKEHALGFQTRTPRGPSSMGLRTMGCGHFLGTVERVGLHEHNETVTDVARTQAHHLTRMTNRREMMPPAFMFG